MLFIKTLSTAALALMLASPAATPVNLLPSGFDTSEAHYSLIRYKHVGTETHMFVEDYNLSLGDCLERMWEPAFEQLSMGCSQQPHGEI